MTGRQAEERAVCGGVGDKVGDRQKKGVEEGVGGERGERGR